MAPPLRTTGGGSCSSEALPFRLGGKSLAGLTLSLSSSGNWSSSSSTRGSGAAVSRPLARLAVGGSLPPLAVSGSSSLALGRRSSGSLSVSGVSASAGSASVRAQFPHPGQHQRRGGAGALRPGQHPPCGHGGELHQLPVSTDGEEPLLPGQARHGHGGEPLLLPAHGHGEELPRQPRGWACAPDLNPFRHPRP